MRIKYKGLPAALLLLGFTVFPASGASVPKAMDVAKSPLHKNYFEIPVAVVPRAGYNFKKTESGVADNAKKVSLDAVLLHMPYTRLLDEITNDCLKKGNMEVKSRSSFIWNGSTAELLKIFQPNGKTVIGKWVLIVDRGADTCWMISGAYNAKDTKAAQAMLDTIKSSWWPADGTGRPAAAATLPANVNTKGTPFRIAGFRQDSLIYTKDGRIPTQDPDQALYVISHVPGQYIPTEKRGSFAEEHIADVERGAKLEIISRTQETVNGLPAIVTVAYTEGEPQSLIYQAVIFKSSKVTLLVGIARKNIPKNLEAFHKLTASYKED